MDFVGAVIQPAQPIVPVTASGQFRLLYFQDIADRNDILRLVSIQEQWPEQRDDKEIGLAADIRALSRMNVNHPKYCSRGSASK